MRIILEMKKLPHVLVALFLVIVPASQGKPLTSQSNEAFKENTGNVNTNEIDNNTSENLGHNNLLSDLARISKDEEANVENRQTIVGTEVSAATVKNSNASSSNVPENADSNTRTTVTNTPTETPGSSYFTSPSPTSGPKESASNASNDMSLVKLSEPMHIVPDSSNEKENPFSKLVTSNENAPQDEKSNDAVNKPQELSPLISGRTEAIPSESFGNKQSTFSGSLPVEESKPLQTKENDGIGNGQTMQDSSSVNAQGNGAKYGPESKNVDKGVNDRISDHVVVCAGEKQTISCPSDTTLNIASANYGIDSNSGCPIDSGTASCQANGVYPVVRSACQGQASCLLQSDGQEFGGMCPGKNNFLKVGYSCYNGAPSSSSHSASTSPQADSPQPSESSYTYQSSPYIPHPVQSTQATPYYNNYAYNQPMTSSYSNYDYNQANNAYMNDNSPGKTNYPYYGYYGNQGYYNYYNQPGKRLPTQTMGRQASSRNYYGYKPKSPPRNPAKRPRPAARPYPPRSNYGSLVNAQYRDYSKKYPQRNYNDYYSNRNYYNTRNNYYDSGYYNQRYSPYGQTNRPSQYPRNSYLGSCYACQNCQQCSEQAYCQGCPKCKVLPCSKKPAREEKYMDPIDSLVEEFGKKTKGMTPMEMSAVVLSPAPKLPETAHSLPLAPPPKALEEDDDGNDDDDGDNDSDESEFVLSDDESNNHEIGNHESTASSEKKTSVSTSKSSAHSTKQKQTKDKTEKGEKRNKIYHRKPKVKKIYDDDDDEDGYDLKVYQNLLKKPKKNQFHRHKNVHSKRRKSKKRLSKRWYNVNENLPEITPDDGIDFGADRSLESPSYEYDGAMFW